MLIVVTLLASALALAHHSAAAVDMTRTETISGTVKEFLWANPHCWIYVLVETEDGAVEEWGIEGPPVMGMARSGLRKTSLEPGDRVEVAFNPRKDGKHGGGFRSVTLLETGETFGTPSFPPPPASGQANEN
jgi:hypothetical protein